MSQNQNSQFNLNTGTDLAFALVVFISYFTTFTNSPSSSIFLITVIIILGIAYISNGIYGFSFAKRSNSITIKLFYFFLQFLIGGLIVYYGKGAGFNALILLPVVAHSAMLLDQDWTLVANAGIVLTYVISIISYSQSFSEVWAGLPLFFAGQVFILIFTQMAVTEQKAREKLEKLASELSEANAHLSEYADRVKELTITQERNRFAREIHDGLGHYLTTINMQIKAAVANIKKDQKNSIHMLETAQSLTSEALLDVRNSVYALRQEGLDSLKLDERIVQLVGKVTSDETKIVFERIGEFREIPPSVDLAIYRAAQETINNGMKHSKASKISITLDFSENDTITFTAADNGMGSEAFGEGFGLIGIKERVRLLNGEVEINSIPNESFTVTIKVPG